MSEQEIEALAHRVAWRYAKSSDPNHSDTYTFNRQCLMQFVGALLAAERERPFQLAGEDNRLLMKAFKAVHQQSIPPDISAVLHANLDSLYIEDKPPATGKEN